jgi:Flp pilus assembly protein TadG
MQPSVRNRSGIALIWIAIVGLVLVALAGLALDTGLVMLTGHQLQNAADAAALAGANSVSFDTAQSVTDALATAAANKAAGAAVQLDSASDIIIGVYDRSSHTFTAGSTPPNAVKVIARRTDTAPGGPLNLIFAPMFGITTSNVSRQAIAMTSPLGAGVILLNKTASPSLQMTGTGSNPTKLNVTNGGAVVIDSSSATAVQWTGRPSINSDSLYIVGNDTAVQTSSVIYPSGDLHLNSQYVSDPLAWLPEPPKGTDRSGSSGPNLQPGYYPSGLPSGNLTLAAGVYYIDGGINLSGNRTINATPGVMLFVKTGPIDISGGAAITINPPTSGTYKGISMYSARDNTSTVSLQGNPGDISSGTLYFPSAHVNIAGNPTSTASQLIADTLTVQGNSQLNINYNNSNPIPRHQSFLVQ